MVTKIVPVRAVNLSIGPFCTEFWCERFCDDDVFLGSESTFGPRDINTEMVTKIVAVRAVNFSIGPFCTEFRCEQLCDDDVFLDRDQFFDDFRSISDRFPIDFQSISGRFPVDIRSISARFRSTFFETNIFVSNPMPMKYICFETHVFFFFTFFCNQYIGLWYPYSRGQTNTNIPYSFQTNTNIE